MKEKKLFFSWCGTEWFRIKTCSKNKTEICKTWLWEKHYFEQYIWESKKEKECNPNHHHMYEKM